MLLVRNKVYNIGKILALLNSLILLLVKSKIFTNLNYILLLKIQSKLFKPQFYILDFLQKKNFRNNENNLTPLII